jgi:RNA polymerase sigma-70 factor (ECF subfamily)
MRLSATMYLAAAKDASTAPDWRAADEDLSERGSSDSAASARRMVAAEFQVFYARSAPGLRAYIRRASGNEALADDILQESFLRFLRADLPALEDAPMKAYLYKIASSLLSDHWRRVKRERRWSLKNFFGGAPVENPNPDHETMHVFERLKAQEQLLLWLAYVEGFEHREIAAALGLKEKSVRVLLFRARKRLADELVEAGLHRREAL